MFGEAIWPEQLVLTRNRDFVHGYQMVDENGSPVELPKGRLFYEVHTDPVSVWDFQMSDCWVWVQVPASVVNAIPNFTRWELVWVPEGGSGVAVALGSVAVQP